jgi:MFS family permease
MRLLSPVLRWFLFAMVLANIASQMVFALLPVYLAELGASVPQVGLVFSVASLVPLALQIFGGWLSDSIGRLRTVAIGAAAASLGYFVLALAPAWEWGMLGLGLEYISGSLVAPSFGAFIAEQSGEGERGRVFGASQGIFMIVGVVGPALGGLLAARLGFKPMLLVAALVYTLAAGLRIWMATSARFAPPARAAAGSPPRLSFHSFRASLGALAGLLAAGGVLTWILVTDGARDVAFLLASDLQPLYLSRIGGMRLEQIGWLSSLFGLAMMLTTLPAGWLSDRRGERAVIVAGFLLQSLGFLLFLVATDFPGFAASMLIFGVGAGVMGPAYNALISKAVPEEMRGIAFGLFQTSIGVLSLPAPWAGAQLWERFSPRLPFALAGLATLVSALPAWFKFRLPPRENPPAPAPLQDSNLA